MVRYRVGMDYFPFFLAEPFLAGLFLAGRFFLAELFLAGAFLAVPFFPGRFLTPGRGPVSGGWPGRPPVGSPDASTSAAASRAARCAPFDVVFFVAVRERFGASAGSFSATGASDGPSAPASMSTKSDHRMWYVETSLYGITCT